MFSKDGRARGLVSSALFFVMMVVLWTILISAAPAKAKSPKSKFYDFNEQLIDGQIKKPTTLYTNAREAVKFERLLKLKKSFLPQLFKTSKEKVFK
tara:strand:+ start:90 stop:377 length:288 start_codon:yes stop_codon:yes gene_type:complete